MWNYLPNNLNKYLAYYLLTKFGFFVNFYDIFKYQIFLEYTRFSHYISVQKSCDQYNNIIYKYKT